MTTSSALTPHNTNQTEISSEEDALLNDNAVKSSGLTEVAAQPLDIRVSDIIVIFDQPLLFPQRSLQTADELKAEGNEYFRGKRWDEALAQYRSALGNLPKRKEKRPDTQPLDESDSNSDKGKGREVEEEVEEIDPLDTECARARAVLNANIGACYVKLVIHCPSRDVRAIAYHMFLIG